MTEIAENSGRPRSRRGRLMLWGGAALLLLLPAVAMQFTNEVSWDGTDFIVFGAMLFAACGTYELAAKATRNRTYLIAASIALVAAFLLIWINLAVGIIGNESNPANQMYWGVLLVGILGALVARFRASGLVYAMVATAVAQVSAGIFALVAGLGNVLLLTIVFAALWLLSARQFHKAAYELNRDVA